MLAQRIVTALTLLLIVLLVLWSGNQLAFELLLMVFALAAFWESARLFGFTGIRNAFYCAVGAGILLLAHWNLFPPLWLLLFALGAWCVLFVVLFHVRLLEICKQILPWLFLWVVALCFVAMENLYARAPTFIFSAAAIVWLADVGAYFAGKACGKHKLAPSISPGKTWEGVVGGVLLVIAVAALFTVLWPQTWQHGAAPILVVSLQQKMGWIGWGLALLTLVAASVLGDLLESFLKRRAGVKDSSALLPGHGGVLDRIDALLPTMPLVWGMLLLTTA